MAVLPSDGEISFNNINKALGRPETAEIGLREVSIGSYATINTNSSTRPNGASPYTMSSFRGYNHSASGGSRSSIGISPRPSRDSREACSNRIEATAYYEGDMTKEGTIYYTASTGDRTLESGWYLLDARGTTILLDKGGKVQEVGRC